MNEIIGDDNAYGSFFDALKKIDEIDIDAGLNRVNGMKDMYHDNLKMFHDKMMADNDKLDGFIKNEDFNNFSISVHAVKSMFASVGALELANLAFNLENASKNGDTQYCKRNFPSFSQKITVLHEKMLSVFPPEVKAKKTEKGGTAYLNENVQKALKAVKNYDNDKGIEILNKIMEYDYNEENNELLLKAANELKQYLYDEAIETLTKIDAGE